MLRTDSCQAALSASLTDVTRLVLLGDVIELRHGPMRDALELAAPALRAIGAALAPDAEVVIVPGNHDHQLMAAWLGRRELAGDPAPLGLETAVDWTAGEPLAWVAEQLAPARVRAAYPGVWLSDEVYATHGHYLDVHTTVPLVERLGAGLMLRVTGGGALESTEDYETVLAPIYAWVHALAQGPSGRRRSRGPSTRAWRVLNSSGRRHLVRRSLIRAGLPLAVRALGAGGLGELRADVSGPALRSAGLRAMVRVTESLGIGAEHVVFGHTHRAGPLERDGGEEWITASGTRLVNSGCWVNDPAYLGTDARHSPYRPGFAVWVDGAGPPELVNLLDEAGGGRLRAR